jgi:hypothetical protein
MERTIRTAVSTVKENREVCISSPPPYFTLTLYALDPYIMVPVISLSTHTQHTVRRVA